MDDHGTFVVHISGAPAIEPGQRYELPSGRYVSVTIVRGGIVYCEYLPDLGDPFRKPDTHGVHFAAETFAKIGNLLGDLHA